MKAIALTLMLYCGGALAECFVEESSIGWSIEVTSWCSASDTREEVLFGMQGIEPVPYLFESDGDDSLFINLMLDPDNFLSIKSGEMLEFVTDSGAKIILKAASDGKKGVIYDSAQREYTRETAPYPISEEQLKILSEANYVNFFVHTGKKSIKRKLTSMQLKTYKEFLTEIVATGGSLQ